MHLRSQAKNMTRIIATDFPTGAQRRITVDGEPVLILNHEGSIHAVSYYCGHMEYPLEGATVEDGLLVCPYHGAGFCLKTGKPDGPPAMDGIHIYSVTIQDNGELTVTQSADT